MHNRDDYRTKNIRSSRGRRRHYPSTYSGVNRLSKQQFGWVGKAIIDPEKITFYKFGLKLGISRLATNGLVVNECGIIRNVGLIIPEVHDMQVLRDVYELFGKRLPY